MLVLTEDAKLVCMHEMGKVSNKPSQTLMTVMGRKVLVDNDPEGRPIASCPNVGAAIKPCQYTLRVKAGYSNLVSVDDKAVCLDTVRGLTDGTPPGVIEYKVNDAGQHFVSERA